MEKGFKDASLRNIVQEAGVTTGAFYGYFKSKEDIFEALVKDLAESFLMDYNKRLESFKVLSYEDKMTHMNTFSDHYASDVIDSIYDYFDEFTLLFVRSEGTRYEQYINEIIQLEMASTMLLIEELNKHGHKPAIMDRDMVHIILSSYFNGILEVLRQQMDKNAGKKYLLQLSQFHRAGWEGILKS